MNFRVSRQYSDLPSDIITGERGGGGRIAPRERRTCEVVTSRKGDRGFSSTGRRETGDREANDFVGEEGRKTRGRFILLNVKFHVGTQL